MTERISRNLTRLLRHQAVAEGLSIDGAGFVPVQQLLQHASMRSTSFATLQQIVAQCPKQRFQMEKRAGSAGADAWYIRAVQGHSMEAVHDDQLLRRIDADNLYEFPLVIHGTYRQNLASIMAGGLSKMSRNNVHFATQIAIGDRAISGLRKSAEILIELDLPTAIADGVVPFYLSTNHVVLSPGDDSGCVPPKYFRCIYEVARQSGGARGGSLRVMQGTPNPLLAAHMAHH